MRALSTWGIVVLLLAAVVLPAARATAQDEVTLVPYTSETFGIQGVVPDGWTEASPGVYLPDGTGQAARMLIQQVAPGMSAGDLGNTVAAQYGLPALPDPAGTHASTAFDWTLYQFEIEAGGSALVVDLALAESGNTSYVVLLQALAAEHEALRPAIFLPAVEALAPLGETGEAERFVDPDGRYSVPIPTNWTAQQADGYAVLSSPDDLIQVNIVVVAADDVYAAEEAAWAIVDPGFDPDAEPDYTEFPVRDLDEFALFTYPPQDDRQIAVEVRLTDGVGYVLIFDTDRTEIQKRQAQVQIIDSGFEIASIAQVDLTAVEPRPIDRALIAELEAYIRDAMARFETPGASVAIVQDGEVVYASGFGTRAPDDDTPITPDTRMMIGSTTKTLTTLLMAILVDEGAMNWVTPVEEILPSFEVSDPAITETLTMENLVCACSGVPRRDFEWVMMADELSAEDMIASLAEFEFFTDFGEAFQYSNQLVATGGYVAALAAGGDYGELEQAYYALLHDRVLDPIGMPSTTFDFDEVEAAGDYAVPYGANLAGENVRIPLDIEKVLLAVAPAGALWSNATDMANYMIVLMNEGVTPDGERIVSSENLRHTWEPQVAIAATVDYGLGWIVSDYHGLPMYSHSGNTFGYSSEFTFLPEARLGIVVQTNQRASLLNGAVSGRFFELVYDQEPVMDESITHAYGMMRDQSQELLDDLRAAPMGEHAEALVGTWTNDALGVITITREDGMLWLDAGEFVTELRQFDPDSEPAETADGPLFILYDPPLAGLPLTLTENDTGDAVLVLGSALVEYTFTPVGE